MVPDRPPNPSLNPIVASSLTCGRRIVNFRRVVPGLQFAPVTQQTADRIRHHAPVGGHTGTRASLALLLVLSGPLACSSSSAIPKAPAQRTALAVPADDPRVAPLQEALDAFVARTGAPGATLGLVFPDGRTLALVSGVSDRERRIPLARDAKLLAGSVGKTFVSAVALQLVSERRLELDAPISRWFGNEPWFARLPNAKDITVRQLMRHTSGLVRYEFQPAFGAAIKADLQRVWTPLERLSYIFDLKPPFAAGEGWVYSDTNYIVLGMIIERITGKAYDDELSRRLLRPLRLDGIIVANRPDLPGIANGYAGPKNELGGFDATLDSRGVLKVNPQLEWTGGGVASTALDLARWGWLLYEGHAFPPNLLPAMLDSVPAQLGPNTRYGLGVIIRETSLGTALGHSGFFPGYATELLYVKSRRTSAALQVNRSDPYPRGMNAFLVEAIQKTTPALSRAPAGADVSNGPPRTMAAGCDL
jgi:D-alanyl-D-alanine carboxypeptidase